MDRFPGVDYYHLDFTLGDEERAVVQTVRRFVDERFLPGLRDHVRSGTFPTG